MRADGGGPTNEKKSLSAPSNGQLSTTAANYLGEETLLTGRAVNYTCQAAADLGSQLVISRVKFE